MQPITRTVRWIIAKLLLCGVLLVLSTPVCAESPNFQTGQAAFERGDFVQAFDIFQTLVRQQPGDPEQDFWLGRSAFESGDYEAAIFAFERVLIADPTADRVRLELARTQYQIGDYEAARSNFDRVLSNQPPANVKQNIDLFLQQIDRSTQKHNLNGVFSIAVSYDDNVYVSPVEDEIETVIGNVTLAGNGATPEEDVVNRNTLQLTHLYRRHPKAIGWMTSGLLHNALYSAEEDLNLTLAGVTTGPIWQQGDQQTKIQGSFNILTLDEERYLSVAGVSAEHSRALTPRLMATFSGQLSRLNYVNDGRDANQYRFDIKPILKLGAGQLLTTVGGEFNEAKDDQYSYLRGTLQMRYQQPLPWKLSSELSVRLQATDYDGEVGLFGKAREDRLRELSLGLSRPLWQKQGTRLLAQLLGTITKVNSNIDLYEYDKQVISLTLSYQF